MVDKLTEDSSVCQEEIVEEVFEETWELVEIDRSAGTEEEG